MPTHLLNLETQLHHVKPKLIHLARRSRQVLFDSDDLVNEVCRVALLRNIDWSVSQEGWLVVAARNILRTAARRRGCWQRFADYCSASTVDSAENTVVRDVEIKELSDSLSESLATLPRKERIVVENRFFEFARSVRQSTERTCLYRAKRRLREDPRVQHLYRDHCQAK